MELVASGNFGGLGVTKSSDCSVYIESTLLPWDIGRHGVYGSSSKLQKLVCAEELLIS